MSGAVNIAQQGNSAISSVISIIIPILIFLAVYLIPTFIAVRKNHFQKTAIVLVNILLGWTFFWLGNCLGLGCHKGKKQ